MAVIAKLSNYKILMHILLLCNYQVTLEGRAGALASMHSFLLFCPELAADDTIRRLLLPIEAAILMLTR